MNITQKWEINIFKVLNKNCSFIAFTQKYMALNTNLNCLPIEGYEYVTKSHASTTDDVLRSHNNELNLSWKY